MVQVTIHEAKTHLSRLIKTALAGEEVIIARGKKPLVRITPLPGARNERKIGAAPGLIEYMAEDLNTPLEELSEYHP